MESKKTEKKINHANSNQKKAVVAMCLSDTIDSECFQRCRGIFYNNKRVKTSGSYNNYRNIYS